MCSDVLQNARAFLGPCFVSQDHVHGPITGKGLSFGDLVEIDEKEDPLDTMIVIKNTPLKKATLYLYIDDKGIMPLIRYHGEYRLWVCGVFSIESEPGEWHELDMKSILMQDGSEALKLITSGNKPLEIVTTDGVRIEIYCSNRE